MDFQNTERIIQESVPGKQITLSHIIAKPTKDVYERLGLEECGAIGILTLTPYETAIIAGDIASKAASVGIGFLDRFTGSLIIYGDVESVQTALEDINRVFKDVLGFITMGVTRT